MSAPTVQLRGAAKHYRGTAALAGIDLDLYQGVVGLLGPNGAGKTTLLRMLATVLGSDQGSVRILGRDPALGAQRTDIRRRLGYLPQELGYPRGFSAYGFLDYMAVLKEWDDPAQRRTEVRRVLEQVDLGDRATKRIRALSGGQRRRVGLAQALLGTPELLVLDGGAVRFDGMVRDLVATADGRVWLTDAVDPRAKTSWRTGTGRYRNLGAAAPAGTEVAEPSLEDAYLLLRASVEGSEVAA